jgi:hypothetical protein
MTRRRIARAGRGNPQRAALLVHDWGRWFIRQSACQRATAFDFSAQPSTPHWICAETPDAQFGQRQAISAKRANPVVRLTGRGHRISRNRRSCGPRIEIAALHFSTSHLHITQQERAVPPKRPPLEPRTNRFFASSSWESSAPFFRASQASQAFRAILPRPQSQGR